MAERYAPCVLDSWVLSSAATVFLARLTNSAETVHDEMVHFGLPTF